MTGRILIAFASKSNAAAEHAGAIAGALKGAGRDVDIVNLRERKPDLAGYGSAVIGSGVRIGRWYGPARRLLKRKELKGMKVALFVACGSMCEPGKEAEAMGYIDKMEAKCGLAAVEKKAFPGFLPGAGKPVDTEASRQWGAELAALL